MKNRKPTTLVVTIALVVALVMAVGLTGCNPPKPTPPPAPAEYTVTFVGGEGASGTAPAAQSKKEGEKIVLPANTFTKVEHTFTGWSDGTSTYQPNAEYIVGTKDVTFTAQWEKTKYAVTYAKGAGVTGDVPAAVNKAKGETIKLDDGSKLSKENSLFVGWNDGTDLYAAGDEYTIDGAATLTAEWFTYGECKNYADKPEDSDTITLTATTFTFSRSGRAYENGGWVDKVFTTEYGYTIKGSVVTFTDEEDSYTGKYADGKIIISVPLQISAYAANVTPCVLTTESLTPISDIGSNGFAQPWDFSQMKYYYFYTDGTAVYTDEKKENYQIVGYDIKVGTYTKDGKVYTVNFADAAVPVEIYLTLMEGVAFYDAKDTYSGEYTQGTGKVTLDGFGNAKIGEEAGTYGIMGTMIALENTDSGESGIYAFDATAKTIGATDITAASAYVLWGEYNSVNILYCDGTSVGKIGQNEAGKKEYASYSFAQVGKKMSDNAIYVNIAVGEYQSLTGVAYKKANAVAAGNYVDNIDSTVTATVEGTTLTITKGADSTTYTLTLDNNAVTFKPESGSNKNGYYVDGVLYGSLVIGETTQVVALTQTKLTTISGVAAGYVVNSKNESQKLYLFTSGTAVYVSGTTGKVGIYTSEENTYTVYYAKDTSSTVYGVTVDGEGTAASYLLADKFAGEYTLTEGTLKISGFGKWTLGDETGDYTAAGNGLVLYKAGNPYKVLSYDQYDKIMEEAESVTWTGSLTATSKTNQTSYLNGLVFSDDVVVYKAGYSVVCAKLTYTLNGENKEIIVCTGDVIEINGITFTVGSIDAYQVRMSFPNEAGYQGKSSIVYEPDMGGVG